MGHQSTARATLQQARCDESTPARDEAAWAATNGPGHWATRPSCGTIGRDVGFGKTIQFEFGVRHAFNPNLVLDVSAYNKNFLSDLAYRIKPYDDPTNPGRTMNVNVLTTADFGYARGVDFKLDKRIGSWLEFSGAYTFQV